MREFLVEASEIVESMATGFSLLDEGRRKGRVKPSQLNDVFRAAHSLKGLAGMFGVEAIGILAHEMETLLDGLRLGRVTLDDGVMDLLYACADAFTRSLGALKAGEPDDMETASNLVERLQRAASKAGGGASEAASVLKLSAQALSVLTEYEEHRLSENLRERRPIYRVSAPLPLDTFESDLSMLTELLTSIGEVITTLPSADNTGTGIDFDLIVATNAPDHELTTKLRGLSTAYGVERVDRQTAAPTGSGDGGEGAHLAEDDMLSLRQVADTVRVDIDKLDELMGIVGELVLARGGLTRVTDELKNQLGYRGIAVDLHRLVRTVERRISDLQSAIMQVRMIPLGQVFDRLARVVRRVASGLGKEVDLRLAGEETELDKLIVEDLVDPLMHLVRNAIDHGLEAPDDREGMGKPRAGTLRMRAFPRGNHVVLVVEDDGRGIDEVAVRRTALERGIVSEDQVGALTQRDVWNLIFDPGFSTKKAVSETSGRGVGLDVVKHNIARLSGIIDVHSEAGQGTTFTITLPITLAIIQSLIVHCRDQVFALPLASVLEIVLITETDLCFVDGREMVEVRGDTLPLLRLDEHFAISGPRPVSADDEEHFEGLGYVAVVGLAQHRVALFVDDVTGQQDIVIKSLGAYLSNVRGFAGATQLGDHETILVLDVAALVSEFIERNERRPGRAPLPG